MSLSDREWDDLKLLLDKAVYKFLGFSEPSLVTAALNCIDKGYDEAKTAGKHKRDNEDRFFLVISVLHPFQAYFNHKY